MTEARARRAIEITRVYDAPRELVWRAWTKPDRLARWWGRRGWNADRGSIVIEPWAGGRFHVLTIAAADGAELATDGVYREVVAPERIVFAQDGGDAVATVTFADLGDGRTEMRFRATIEASEDVRAAAVAGLGSAFERLAELLTTESRRQA